MSSIAPWLLLLGCAGEVERAATRSTISATDSIPAADLHLHIGSQASADLVGSLQPSSARDSTTAQNALDALDAAGVDRGLVLSMAYLFGGPEARADQSLDEEEMVRAENDYVAAQLASVGDRLVGACSVNPLADYAHREVDRCLNVLGFGVLKLHFTNSDVDLRSDDHLARLEAVWQVLESEGAAAYVHMRTRAEDYGAQDAKRFIDDVIAPRPGVPVHVAHMSGWGGYDDATDEALGEFVTAIEEGRLDRQRIWFGLGAVVFQPEAAGADTALARTVREANQKLASRVRQLGTDRVTYATDWPSWPPVSDMNARIVANVRLVRGSLGLTGVELAEVFANEGLLGGR